MAIARTTTTPVVIPELGEGVTVVRVVRWLKQVGDAVAADEGLLEISTEKIDVLIESPVAGVVVGLDVEAGDKVAIGATVATIGPLAP